MNILLPLLIFLFSFYQIHGQVVNIPDPEFKNILINYESYIGPNIDTNNDNEIQYSEAAAMTGTLDVGDPWVFNGQIQDLTGIEAFVNITKLICSNNQLTNLDLSQNTALVKLWCTNNQLTSLNVTQCTLLEELYCTGNQLSVLNVNQNTTLEILYCEDNQITNLDVTQNVFLKFLRCENNQLSSLDVTQNTDLEFLHCHHNNIAVLNLTQNIGLEIFNGAVNQFTELDIRNGNNTNIIGFNTTNNPDLICIFVDNASYSSASSSWVKDPSSTYVETQQQCDDVSGIQESLLQKIKLYPNPTKNKIHIDSPIPVEELELYNLKGKKILTVPFHKDQKRINLSALSTGLYLLKLTMGDTQLIKKIIKL